MSLCRCRSWEWTLRGYLEAVGQVRSGVLGDLCLQPVDKRVVESVDMLGELRPLGGGLRCHYNASLRKSLSGCARKSAMTSLCKVVTTRVRAGRREMCLQTARFYLVTRASFLSLLQHFLLTEVSVSSFAFRHVKITVSFTNAKKVKETSCNVQSDGATKSGNCGGDRRLKSKAERDLPTICCQK